MILLVHLVHTQTQQRCSLPFTSGTHDGNDLNNATQGDRLVYGAA